MRHRKAGKKLDRRDQERVALYRNLTVSLIERFGTPKEFILTSVAKAKAVRPFAEKIITIAIKARKELEAAAKALGTTVEGLREQHEKGSAEGKGGKKFARAQKKPTRKGAKKPAAAKPPTPVGDLFPQKVREHVAKSVHLRRLAISRLRNEASVKALIDKVAPRFLDRKGGYLRIYKTSQWVLGDGSTKALIGFVGGENLPPTTAPAERKAGATVGAK